MSTEIGFVIAQDAASLVVKRFQISCWLLYKWRDRGYNPAMSNADIKPEGNEDSEEIAAALAAVYACLASETEQPLSVEKREISNWALACRFEAVNPCAGKINGYTQISRQKSASKWRSSFARRFTSLTILALGLTAVLAPQAAFGLERIQFDADATQAAAASQENSFSPSSREPLCPMAPRMQLENDKISPVQAEKKTVLPAAPVASSSTSSGSGLTIRIALETNAQAAEIVLPDGGRILDESTHELLAELPPQSRWYVAFDKGENCRRLVVAGRLASPDYHNVLLASKLGKFGNDTFAGRQKSLRKGDFVSPPQILSRNDPKFVLPVQSPQAPAALPGGEFRPVSYAAPSLTNSVKPALPPPVVSGYILKPTAEDGVFSCAGRTYRGKLLIKPRTSVQDGFLLINLVQLEDYLLSVLPSEMPASWSLEALKAQAVAARSYALANLNKHRAESYDLKANTEDQVYLGVETESESSNRAVAETCGLVLKHNGKVVSAFFHSSGGGATEKCEHVWGSKVPYLKSVPDFDDQSPHFAWNRTVPVANIEESLKKQGKEIGALLGIFPLERSGSQRVSMAMIAGTLKTIIVSGEELRKALGLPSTIFNVGLGPDAYLLAGRGFGHGLGMSQWGAKYLSEQGYNAAQILSYYYKDVAIEQF